MGRDRATLVLPFGDGGPSERVDEVSTAGTLVVTTLDPLYHVGSFFIPAAARFLSRFLPWPVERRLAVPYG